MTTHSVMVNWDGMFEDKLDQTKNGYGINMDLVAKATKAIMNLKLEVKLG